MKHAAGAQASLDIAAEEVFDVMSDETLVRKGENRCLGALACPLDGRILISGGAYGKCSIYHVYCIRPVVCNASATAEPGRRRNIPRALKRLRTSFRFPYVNGNDNHVKRRKPLLLSVRLSAGW